MAIVGSAELPADADDVAAAAVGVGDAEDEESAADSGEPPPAAYRSYCYRPGSVEFPGVDFASMVGND